MFYLQGTKRLAILLNRYQGDVAARGYKHREESPDSSRQQSIGNNGLELAKAIQDGECHRKNTAQRELWVRVKRRGKSPPHGW